MIQIITIKIIYTMNKMIYKYWKLKKKFRNAKIFRKIKNNKIKMIVILVILAIQVFNLYQKKITRIHSNKI